MIAVFVAILVVAIGILFSMLVSSLAVSIGAAMFLDLPWRESLEKVWDQPGYLILFSLIILPFLSSFRDND